MSTSATKRIKTKTCISVGPPVPTKFGCSSSLLLLHTIAFACRQLFSINVAVNLGQPCKHQMPGHNCNSKSRATLQAHKKRIQAIVIGAVNITTAEVEECGKEFRRLPPMMCIMSDWMPYHARERCRTRSKTIATVGLNH